MTSERREMLPGRSSVQLDRIFAVPFLIAGVAASWLLIGRILDRSFYIQLPTAGSIIALVALVLAGVPAVLFLWLSLRRRAAEERAGYTLFARRRQDLEQLDPLTGAVLREAGEAYPTKSDMRERLSAARVLQS